jgi:hypothetical protein
MQRLQNSLPAFITYQFGISSRRRLLQQGSERHPAEANPGAFEKSPASDF